MVGMVIILVREPAWLERMEAMAVRRLRSMSDVSWSIAFGSEGSGGGGSTGDVGIGESILAGEGFVGSGEAMSAIHHWDPGEWS